LYASTSEIRDQWVKAIRDVTGIFEFEDLFEKGRTLGTGHFSTVYVAKRKSDQEVFAVKVINKTSLSEDEKELLRSEIAILKLVHHPNIIGTEQIMEGQKSINIVTELVRGGELFSHIAGRKTLSEEEAYTLFHPVISAVEYLHKMGIVHRDIKPENILCEEGFQNIKIADFGLGKLVRVAWAGGVVGW
jgi:serine/threonine protein kinase